MIKSITKTIIASITIRLPLPFMVMLDLIMEIYHQICFPLYGITKIKRSEYFELWDRPHLRYLNWWQKMGCAYCGYANGLAAYFKEITNSTEAYRCPIVHKYNLKGQEHQKEEHFAPYGNKAAYDNKHKAE